MSSSLEQESISIHAPYEGGDVNCNMTKYEIVISIHAPYEGGDCNSVDVADICILHFNPRPL